ncbi:hypothetical protein D3C77_391870 [compost metagenome]
MLGIDPSGQFERITKAQMNTAFRSQVGTGNLGLAIGLHLWLDRAKGQIGYQVGKVEAHFRTAPGHQHLGGTDGIEQLGVAFRWLCLFGIQHQRLGITLIEGDVGYQCGPCLAVVPDPWRARQIQALLQEKFFRRTKLPWLISAVSENAHQPQVIGIGQAVPGLVMQYQGPGA